MVVARHEVTVPITARRGARRADVDNLKVLPVVGVIVVPIVEYGDGPENSGLAGRFWSFAPTIRRHPAPGARRIPGVRRVV